MNTQSSAPAAAAPKKRSLWFYALVVLGCLLLVAIVAVIGIIGYAKSLVNSYTSTAPQPIMRTQFDPQRMKELEARWNEFAEAVRSRQNPAPYEISAEDINLVLSRDKNVRDRLRFSITNNQLLLNFSTPLTELKRKELSGRYLNGTAKLDFSFQNGRFDVGMGALEANGKAVPGWIVKQIQEMMRLQKENALKEINQNPEASSLLQGLESVAIKDNKIVLTPNAGGR